MLAALCAQPVSAWCAEKSALPAVARFESLKKLAGDWVQTGPDGKPMADVAATIRVTAGGSVVQETLFPGSDHEMVTMYHLDGAELVLTHYCAVGNQPRMRAVAGGDLNRIEFKFSGGSNLKPGVMHMDHATLTIVSQDHVKAEWVAAKDGEACHKANFELLRKK
jgi:hypothetical protein